MGLLEPTHLILILIVALVLFGPKKIPELMRGLGKGMGELQKGINEGKRMLSEAVDTAHQESQTHLYSPPEAEIPPSEPSTPTIPVQEVVAPPAEESKPSKPSPKARLRKPSPEA